MRRFWANGHHRAGAGFTLTELIISLAVMGVLAAVAVPSMMDFIMRKRIDGAANELMSALRGTRSMTFAHGRQMFVRFSTTDTFTCYVVYDNPGAATCNCSSWPAASCTTSDINVRQPTAYNTVVLELERGITLSQANGDPFPVAERDRLTLSFDFNGMPVAGQTLDVAISSSRGSRLRVLTNSAGVPSICAVSSDFPAYPTCPITP